MLKKLIAKRTCTRCTQRDAMDAAPDPVTGVWNLVCRFCGFTKKKETCCVSR